jgi:hypothetical protein
MKLRLMLGGFAASLLSGAAGMALAASPLDAPLVLADRTLVRLERLDITADPATGEPSLASRRRLERLLADEPRRGCVVAAQVLGRIDRAELDGGDPLEAHRRARARAERTAAMLSAAGIDRDRVVAAWDPSGVGDSGRLTIWLMTDWSEPGCGLLPSDEPRVAVAPPPSGTGLVERGAGLEQSGSSADTATSTRPIASRLKATQRPSPGEPNAAASEADVASETGRPAPRPTPSDVTSSTPRANAVDTLAALAARIGGLFERDAASGAAASASWSPDPAVDAGPSSAVRSATVAAADGLAAPVAASREPLPAHAPPTDPGIAAGIQPTGAASAVSLPAGVHRTVASARMLPAASPAPSQASPPAARSGQPINSRQADQALATASSGLPDPLGQLRGPAGEAAPRPIAATPVAGTGALRGPPEPAAGGAPEELVFRFPANSSILDMAQKRQLELLAQHLPTDRPVTLKLTVAVGSGDVAGADEPTARRYNRWLAERRAARVERWLRHYAGDRAVALETSLIEDDPSRTARLTLTSGG